LFDRHRRRIQILFQCPIPSMAAGSQSNTARGPTAANSHGSLPPSGFSTQKVLMHHEAKGNLNENSGSSSYIDVKNSVAKNGDNEKTEENGQGAPALDIVINNVVCSFNVRCHLNLRDIALRGLNVEYRKENGMVTMKLRRPYTTASMWSSGKITCTGANSEDQAHVAARSYARLLQKMGFNTRFRNYRVVNVLGTCTMPFAIKITNFSKEHREASYEPELHPGVTYRIKQPKATLKIFSTGSITITAPCVANIQSAVEYIYPLVYPFQKPKTLSDVKLKEDKEKLLALNRSGQSGPSSGNLSTNGGSKVVDRKRKHDDLVKVSDKGESDTSDDSD